MQMELWELKSAVGHIFFKRRSNEREAETLADRTHLFLRDRDDRDTQVHNSVEIILINAAYSTWGGALFAVFLS